MALIGCKVYNLPSPSKEVVGDKLQVAGEHENRLNQCHIIIDKHLLFSILPVTLERKDPYNSLLASLINYYGVLPYCAEMKTTSGSRITIGSVKKYLQEESNLKDCE